MTILFRDRHDAGRRLAEALLRFKDEKPVVLALPRGGVPVGFEVAVRLEAPLDLVIVRKIGAPLQPEYAVAAIADGDHPEIAVNPDFAAPGLLPPQFLQRESARQLREIERRRTLYLADRPRAGIAGHTAIVVDDGIATGSTIRAALRAVRHGQPRRLVLATPVAPPETVEGLRDEVDEVICLATPARFGAIGQFYADFAQLEDAEVVELLARAHDRFSATRPAAEPTASRSST